MHSPTGLGACLTQRGEEPLPISLVANNRLAPIAAVHDVVHGAGVLDAKFARHTPCSIASSSASSSAHVSAQLTNGRD